MREHMSCLHGGLAATRGGGDCQLDGLQRRWCWHDCNDVGLWNNYLCPNVHVLNLKGYRCDCPLQTFKFTGYRHLWWQLWSWWRPIDCRVTSISDYCWMIVRIYHWLRLMDCLRGGRVVTRGVGAVNPTAIGYNFVYRCIFMYMLSMLEK